MELCIDAVQEVAEFFTANNLKHKETTSLAAELLLPSHYTN